MPSPSFPLAALCLLVAQVSATCNPNFEGAPVRILNVDGAQFAPSATQAAWFVQLNGQSHNPSYIIKDRGNTNRALTSSGSDGTLSVTTASNSGTVP
ncbi:hypothetical protein V5O48_014935, partial [Marasmius crinis-equi]